MSVQLRFKSTRFRHRSLHLLELIETPCNGRHQDVLSSKATCKLKQGLRESHVNTPPM